MQEYGQTVTFFDKKNRQIQIAVDDVFPPFVQAIFDGKVIGSAESVEIDGDILLSHINVEEYFQHADIGTRMLSELAELTEFKVPNRSWSSSTGHEFYLTSDGTFLINSCIRAGVLSNQNEAPFDWLSLNSE